MQDFPEGESFSAFWQVKIIVECGLFRAKIKDFADMLIVLSAGYEINCHFI